jgi:6-phosphogluconolactonase (cycloisomerase 2 family)
MNVRAIHVERLFSARHRVATVLRGLMLVGAAGLQIGMSSVSAAPVDSGVLSINVPFTIDGVYLNVVTGANNTTAAATPGWDTNPFFQGTAQPATATFAVFASATGDAQRATVGTSGGGITVLTPGTVVSSASNFSSGSIANAAFANVGSRYYGIRFTNESTGATNYGYVLISTSTGLPSPVTRIVRTGYCNAGEAVTLPAVPGPPICGTRPQPSFVYALLSDAIAGNKIYGYSVNETTGALTPIPGVDPLPTGGMGAAYYRELLTFDPAKRRLYAVNSGSGTVSVYSVDPDTGALTPMPYSPLNIVIPFASTVAVHRSGSPVVVAGAAGGANSVASFNVTDTTATAASGSPFSQLTSASFSSTFSQDGNYYYTGGNNNFGTSGFAVNAVTGVFTILPGSPFSLGPTQLALNTDAAGRLFSINSSAIVNGALSPIAAFTTAAGVPTAIPGSYLPSNLTVPVLGRLSPNGTFFAAAGQDSNTVGVYRIFGSGSATTITHATGSPFASGGIKTCGLSFNATGSLLFVANCQSRNITKFAVDSSAGALSSPATQAVNSIGSEGEIVGIVYAYSDRLFANGLE